MTLTNVLEEICEQEYALPANAPRHRFSLKHRRAMSKILRPDNLPKAEKKLAFKRRIVIIAAVVLLAVVTGAACVIRYGGFRFQKHRDYYHMFAENADKAPQTIEKLCYNNNVPEKYKLFDRGSYEREDNVHFFYYDSAPTFDDYPICERPMVRIMQMTKKRFITAIIPGMRVETIEINGFSGFLMVEAIDDKGTTLDVNSVLWDCGDYIHMVCGTIPMEELLEIAENMTEI